MRRDKVKTAAAKKKSRREDKKNTGARALTRQRRSRQRKWLTFVRMCRYGVNNFTRNAWRSDDDYAVDYLYYGGGAQYFGRLGNRAE